MAGNKNTKRHKLISKFVSPVLYLKKGKGGENVPKPLLFPSLTSPLLRTSFTFSLSCLLTFSLSRYIVIIINMSTDQIFATSYFNTYPCLYYWLSILYFPIIMFPAYHYLYFPFLIILIHSFITNYY